MEKVKLPRRVAEALEEAKGSCGGNIDMIAWNIPRGYRGDVWFWNELYEFSLNNGGFLKLIDALRYGYDIEPEPITVTITPEMQEKVKKYFADKEAERKEAEKDGLTLTVRQIDNEVYGARYILKVLGIAIPGVNA